MTGRHDEESRLLASDPFLAGRTEAAERYGHLSKNAAQWRRISLVLLLCCFACVMAVIVTASKITVVPYIVQVDEHGYEIALSPVAPSKVDARLMTAHVGRYVWSLKTVFNDPEAQLHLMNFVYSTTPANTAAEKKYQEYYAANNPVLIGESETVSVTVNSVLSMSESAWQAEWTEERYSASTGDKTNTKHYRGIFGTAVVTPGTMREILLNPLGIFVTDFNFSEIL
ncbi:MAG: type IV secretion system protein [Synergistaceae bacterium]|jgi:type IV secretion system protein VirB5|nr:type IV secretion system protein [Synergistaceae bacterium]